MRLAIIGGGAAGLVAAYYLSRNHEVVLFEKQEILGGNVRTLGLNVAVSGLPSGVVIDNGVIEFMSSCSPNLVSLLDELGVETRDIRGGSTSYYRENGESIHMPKAIGRMSIFRERVPHYLRLTKTILGFLPDLTKLLRKNPGDEVGEILSRGVFSRWMKGLIMYAYSISFPEIEEFPGSLAVSTLKKVAGDRGWIRIPGGVYSYMQAIVDQSEFDIRLGVKEIQVSRVGDCVQVDSDCGLEEFDQLVFAVPPHEVLKVLADPDEEELASFSGWTENIAETVIHTDTSLYDRWSPPEFTEFDIFEKNSGKDAGYNAYLNRLVGLGTSGPTHFFLAYNLDDKVNPDKVIHRCTHRTTAFKAKTDTRAEIRALSGNNRLSFAGAYLYDGLHEGAVESAVTLVSALNSKGSGS